MQCVDTNERLLTDDPLADIQLRQHVAECRRCAKVARGLKRVDQIARVTLIVAPPFALQQQLVEIALQAARPLPVSPWWQRWPSFDVTAWVKQPVHMIGAQSLAAVLVGVASWQVFGWLSALQPVVGDVGYAMELVAGSPAATYLGGVQIDVQSFGVWSLVGVLVWVASEDGVIGRRLTSRLQLP
jgi:hypothetical protein